MRIFKWQLIILLIVASIGCNDLPKGDYYISYLFDSRVDTGGLLVIKEEKVCFRVQGEVDFETANPKALEYIQKTYTHLGYITVIPDAHPGGSKGDCPNWLWLDNL